MLKSWFSLLMSSPQRMLLVSSGLFIVQQEAEREGIISMPITSHVRWEGPGARKEAGQWVWALGRDAFRRHHWKKEPPSRGSSESGGLGVTSMASSVDQKENRQLSRTPKSEFSSGEGGTY